MVAAWIRAETGVGPAMASGSQTCSGNWADFPIAPPKSRSAPTGRRPRGEAALDGLRVMPACLSRPGGEGQHEDPEQNGTSPVFVVMNALIAALEFSFLLHQCPIRR